MHAMPDSDNTRKVWWWREEYFPLGRDVSIISQEKKNDTFLYFLYRSCYSHTQAELSGNTAIGICYILLTKLHENTQPLMCPSWVCWAEWALHCTPLFTAFPCLLFSPRPSTVQSGQGKHCWLSCNNANSVWSCGARAVCDPGLWVGHTCFIETKIGIRLRWVMQTQKSDPVFI